jgi:hypothetical protein
MVLKDIAPKNEINQLGLTSLDLPPTSTDAVAPWAGDRSSGDESPDPDDDNSR